MILDSTTWEEANSRLWNWIRQRSRWVKGYVQTHLVHTRHPLGLWRRLGLRRGLSVLLTVGGLAAVLLLNPLYWLVVLLWLCIRWRLVYFDFTDGTMQHYTAWSGLSWFFFGAAVMLFAANGVFVLINVVACSRRRQWRPVTPVLGPDEHRRLEGLPATLLAAVPLGEDRARPDGGFRNRSHVDGWPASEARDTWNQARWGQLISAR
jgi:hypothetical protein